MKTLKFPRTVQLLKVASVLWLGTMPLLQAAVIFDDTFDGAEGSAPNPAYWETTGSVALTGDGNVGLNGSFSTLLALPSLGYEPTGDQSGRVTFSNVSGADPFISMGVDLPAWSSVRIAVRNDLISSWVVDINPGGAAYTYFDTTVDRSVLGTWTLEWSTTQVQAYYNGDLVFNSLVDAPTVGDSWTIPVGALRPAFYESAGDTNNTLIGGAKFETVPEPGTLSLFVMGAVLVGCIVRRHGRMAE